MIILFARFLAKFQEFEVVKKKRDAFFKILC